MEIKNIAINDTGDLMIVCGGEKAPYDEWDDLIVNDKWLDILLEMIKVRMGLRGGKTGETEK